MAWTLVELKFLIDSEIGLLRFLDSFSAEMKELLVKRFRKSWRVVMGLESVAPTVDPVTISNTKDNLNLNSNTLNIPATLTLTTPSG